MKAYYLKPSALSKDMPLGNVNRPKESAYLSHHGTTRVKNLEYFESLLYAK